MLSTLNAFGSFRQLLMAMLLCISLVLLHGLHVEGIIVIPYVVLYVVTLVCAMTVVGSGIVCAIMDNLAASEDDPRAQARLRDENNEMSLYIVTRACDEK